MNKVDLNVFVEERLALKRPKSNSCKAQNESGQIIPKKRNSIATQEFFSEQKKYQKTIYAGAGLTALGLVGGAAKWGTSFPAKALQFFGDFFASIAAIAAPVFLVGNEIKNYNLIKNNSADGTDSKKTNRTENSGVSYDDWREGFYRCASLGFTPFIFKPFIDPEQFGKSTWHKVANIANWPNLLFTGYTWGGGNLKALLAWKMKISKQNELSKLTKGTEKYEKAKSLVDGYEQIYKSCKRLATIGSIANPTMQGLRQFADTAAYLTGGMDSAEFFERPFLGASRIVSSIVGIPELFAKGVDSVERITKEYDDLKLALPEGMREPLKRFSKRVQKELSSPGTNTLQSIRHASEVIFHTLSPLSMFALFAPLLDEKHTHEDMQAAGGAKALIDKVVGGYGKFLTVLFTGSYVTLARLPQAAFQLAYFAKAGLKSADDKETVAKVEEVKAKICSNSIVIGISNFSRKLIEKLVPDFYDKNIENEDLGYSSYEQIQAAYAIKQLEKRDEYTAIFEADERDNLSKDQIQKLIGKFVEESKDFARKEAIKGQYKNVNEKDLEAVAAQVRRKLSYIIDPSVKPKRQKPLFPGAEFLVRYLLKLGDLKTRINSIDYRSSHHNMTSAYDNDELRISFEGELMPVVAKCTKGLGSMIERVSSLAA